MAPKKDTKKKAEAPAASEPAAKKAKPEEEEANKAEEESPKEEPKKEEEREREKDAPDEKRKTISGRPISFEPSDCSMNIVPTTLGNMIMPLTDGGMQFLIGGARAGVGLKAGRYMYEVKIVEQLTPDDGRHTGQRGKPPHPKQLCRVGFSVAGAPLILGEGAGAVCFDSEGSFISDGKKSSSPKMKFMRDQVVGVLLNLDPSSPNANTVSLFRNGFRATDPMPLPEELKGQALYPHVAFRNVTVQMNLGSTQMKPLPFTCRMVQDAAEPDVKVTAPEKGKRTVVFPVCLPDEGGFDWADDFLESNPSYTELSDRKVIDWAVKSGCWKGKGGGKGASHDKPSFDFGLQSLDDRSACRVIDAVAPTVPRNYVVMEMKQNLCPEDRKNNLKKFSPSSYKRVAKVIVGKPSAAFVKKLHEVMLKEKQTKLTAEWKARKLEKEKKKLAEERRKKMEEMKKKAEAERKKKMEEARKKVEEMKKKDAEAKGEEGEKAAEGEKAEDEKKEEETKPEEETKEEAEETKEEVKEEEEPEEPEPVAELTEEEKSSCFKRSKVGDLSAGILAANFGKFSIPSKDEGFDQIDFEWSEEPDAKKYVGEFVTKLKETTRVDNLQPGEWFKTTLEEFRKLAKEWEDATEKLKAGAQDVAAPPTDTTIFAIEDWALHTLRFELYLMACSYKQDVNDPDRPGIHEDHISFYYNKYFKKTLMPKNFSRDSVKEVVALLKDSFSFSEKGILTLKIDEGMDASYMLAKQDENRKERQRRIDAGDETARLEFTVLRKAKEIAEKQVADRKAAEEARAKAKEAAEAKRAEQVAKAAEAKAAAAAVAAAKGAAKGKPMTPGARPPLTPGAVAGGRPAMGGAAKGAGKNWAPAKGTMGKGMMMGKGMW